MVQEVTKKTKKRRRRKRKPAAVPQRGRMLKLNCACEGGRPLRGSRTKVTLGPIMCGLCGEAFVLDGEPRPGGEEEQRQAEESARAWLTANATEDEIALEIAEELSRIRSSRRVETATRVMSRLDKAERRLVMDVLKLTELEQGAVWRRT